MSRSDRYFDLTLRILTLAVVAALAGCVAFLMHRFATEAPGDPSAVQLSQAPAPVPVTPLQTRATVEPAVQLLMAPGLIFRCEDRGRITFSDQPCQNGRARNPGPTADR